MKTKSKVITAILCLVLLITASVAGSLALLTDVESTVNTFTVGKVDIILDEAKVNPDGTMAAELEEERVTENVYHLLPGQTYIKDPRITVLKGSASAYIRMMVTINCLSELQAIFGEDFLPQDYVSGWDSSVWICHDTVTDAENNSVTYEFRYYQVAQATNDEDLVLDALFDTFTLPGEITGEQLETLADLKITAVGHAIQAAGLGSEEKAWEAFDEQLAGEIG